MADGTATRPAGADRIRSVVIALIPLAIFLGLAGIFLMQLAAGGGKSEIPSALIGRPAPQFALEPIAGLKQAGADVPGLSRADLDGKVSVVNVWASWCGPCRIEHPLLMELAKRGDFQLVGINYKDQPENALRFLGALGNPFGRVGVDQKGAAVIDWGVYGVPETFIVGADGTILHKHVGPITGQSLQDSFLPALEKAIAGAGAKSG